MKLVLAIIHDDDIISVTTNLTKKHFYVTKLASTGGFLKAGNTTIICGVDDEKVPEVVETIKEHSAKRDIPVVSSSGMGAIPTIPTAITAATGGATIFVLDVEQFIKV